MHVTVSYFKAAVYSSSVWFALLISHRMLRSHYKRPRDESKPETPLMPTVVPGVMQQSYIIAMFQTASNATSGLSIADGIIWRPMERGGTSILRTAAAARGTIFTSTAAFGFGGWTPTVMLTTSTELMVPVSLSLNGSNFKPEFDVATAYYQSTFRKGKMKIQCTTSGVSSNSVISGVVGVALLGDTRGVYSFNRSVIGGKSLFGAAQMNIPISNATTIEIPPFSPGYAQTKHVSTYSRGSLVTFFSAATDAHNCVFVSHLATSSICTSLTLSEIPWGATPNFTVHCGITTPTTPTPVPVRVLNVFAYMDGAGPHIYSVSSTVVAITSNVDAAVVDIPQATPPNPYCIWVGAFILFGINEPVTMDVRAWLPFEQELANSYAVVARIDGAAQDAMISVEGIIYTQCASTSSSYIANVSTVDAPSLTPTEQFADLQAAVAPNNTIVRSEL